MNTRVKLALLNRLHSRSQSKRKRNAFTLIELMIVVAIIGILAAVAIPKYLETRKVAAAQARIGEQIGLAKECSAWVVVKTGATPTGCNEDDDSDFKAEWDEYGSVSKDLKCLDVKSENASTSATITVDSESGELSCAFAN